MNRLVMKRLKRKQPQRPGRKAKRTEVTFKLVSYQTIQDSRYRNQPAAGAFTYGGRDRYFVPPLAQGARRNWAYGFRIYLRRRADARQPEIATPNALLCEREPP